MVDNLEILDRSESKPAAPADTVKKAEAVFGQNMVEVDDDELPF